MRQPLLMYNKYPPVKRGDQATDKLYQKNYSSSKCINLLAAFSLQEVGAIEKAALCSADNRKRLPAYKKKRHKRDFALCGGRGGFRSLHRAAF